MVVEVAALRIEQEVVDGIPARRRVRNIEVNRELPEGILYDYCFVVTGSCAGGPLLREVADPRWQPVGQLTVVVLHPVRIDPGRLAEFVFGDDGNEPGDVVRAAFVHTILGPRHERVGKRPVV